jgi:hypothetical protein
MYLETLDKKTYGKHRAAVIRALKRKYEDKKLRLTQFIILSERFIGGVLAYAEFKSTAEKKDDSYGYIFLRDDKIEIYEDGIDTIVNLKRRMERTQTLLGRFNEFSVPEMIGSILGLIMGAVFAIKFLASAEIPKEYIGMFSLVLGFYFGNKR